MAMWMVASTFHIQRSRHELLNCLRILQLQWWYFVPRVLGLNQELWEETLEKHMKNPDKTKCYKVSLNNKAGMPANLEIFCNWHGTRFVLSCVVKICYTYQCWHFVQFFLNIFFIVLLFAVQLQTCSLSLSPAGPLAQDLSRPASYSQTVL